MELPEIKAVLTMLDARAEAVGATEIRQMIRNVVEDLCEPEGKRNARLAIREIVKDLKDYRPRSVASSFPPPAQFDEATA